MVDNESVGPISGRNASVYSVLNTEYHEILLKWDSCATEEKARRIHRLSRNMLEGIVESSILTSETLQTTMLYLLFNEEYPGFGREYFSKSKRSKGSTTVVSIGMPATWEKYLTPRHIRENLHDVFAAHDLRIITDGTAIKGKLADYKDDQVQRRREQKLKNKTKFDSLNEDARRKIRASLPHTILRDFTKCCRENGMSVDSFIKKITDENEDHEYFHQCIELRERMNNLRTQILEYQTPEPEEELPEVTLRNFCDNNPIDPDITP